jgi:hypothetical protein
MRKIKAFLYRLIFGKPQGPTRVFSFDDGGYVGGADSGPVHTPAQSTDTVDRYVPGELSARVTTPKPVVSRANYPEPPKRVLTVGDISDNKSMVFCKDSDNGKRTV